MLVQSYVEAKTEAVEENGIESKTDVIESHFGNSISYTTKNTNVEYINGGNTISYSYTVTGANDNERIKALSTIAEQRGQNLAEMALALVLKDKVIISVLIGDSKPEQILDNINCIQNTSFSADELNAINKLSII
ncbi:aldo/keto reductase [Eubacterium sp.]|uniref:aldo/keto reductase n=1 Tax=Eubacterium sp. TaxID=142586 RepID=UPI0039953224